VDPGVGAGKDLAGFASRIESTCSTEGLGSALEIKGPEAVVTYLRCTDGIERVWIESRYCTNIILPGKGGERPSRSSLRGGFSFV
jgi:hypothetical protein